MNNEQYKYNVFIIRPQQSGTMSNQHPATILHYTCLYTTQKTQKRKRWCDGKLSLNLDSKMARLYSINANSSAIDTLELMPSQVRDIRSKAVEELEFEKHLVQVEDVWTEKGNSNSFLPQQQQARMRTSSLGMQKLLKKKFIRPAAYIPSKPNIQDGMSSMPALHKNRLKNRKRPLQPGELVRMHYGTGRHNREKMQQEPHFFEDVQSHRVTDTSNEGPSFRNDIFLRRSDDPASFGGRDETGSRDMNCNDINSRLMSPRERPLTEIRKYDITSTHRSTNLRSFGLTGGLRDASDYDATEYYGEEEDDDEGSLSCSEDERFGMRSNLRSLHGRNFETHGKAEIEAKMVEDSNAGDFVNDNQSLIHDDNITKPGTASNFDEAAETRTNSSSLGLKSMNNSCKNRFDLSCFRAGAQKDESSSVIFSSGTVKSRTVREEERDHEDGPVSETKRLGKSFEAISRDDLLQFFGNGSDEESEQEMQTPCITNNKEGIGEVANYKSVRSNNSSFWEKEFDGCNRTSDDQGVDKGNVFLTEACKFSPKKQFTMALPSPSSSSSSESE